MVGFTATAFSSLSLDPPLVLFCMDNGATGLPHFRECRTFAINVLAEDQAHVSNGFARSGEGKFSGVPTRIGEAGAPLIEDCLVNMECSVREILPGGDHTIFVGEVQSAHLGEGEPLLFYQGEYRMARPLPPRDE